MLTLGKQCLLRPFHTTLSIRIESSYVASTLHLSGCADADQIQIKPNPLAEAGFNRIESGSANFCVGDCSTHVRC